MERVSIWIAALALVLGGGSIATATILAQREHTALCDTKTEQNQQVRDFVSDLLDNPNTPQAVKDQVRATAVKRFPAKGC